MHRVALRAARHVERPSMSNCGPRANRTRRSTNAPSPSATSPSPSWRADLDELRGALVAVVAVEEAAAAEVLAGERVGRGDRVPRGPAVAQVVERGELAGQLVGLVERGVERGGEADAVGDGGQRGEHGERVGPADDVEVEDPAAVLAQPQALGEEEEVELAPLGGLGEVDERGEVGLAARLRVAPHRGVVDAGEVGGEVELLHDGAHAGVRPDEASPKRSRSVMPGGCRVREERRDLGRRTSRDVVG